MESPGNNESIVKIDYSLISPGTEINILRDEGFNNSYQPGYVAAGILLESKDERLQNLTGKRVFCFPAADDSSGCHASVKLMRRNGLLVEIPEALETDKACFARFVNIAMTPYCNASPKTMGSVLVSGLGPVGNLVGQVGRIRGFQVIGADPNPVRREKAMQAGFDTVLDPFSVDLASEVKALTGGGADLTVSATGLAAPFIDLLKATTTGGEVSTLGGAWQGVQENLGTVISEIHLRHLTVRGGWELMLPFRSAGASPVASVEANLKNAFRWLGNNAINLAPVWTKTIDPENFAEAYQQIGTGNDDYFGVVVDWTKCS